MNTISKKNKILLEKLLAIQDPDEFIKSISFLDRNTIADLAGYSDIFVERSGIFLKEYPELLQKY